MISDLFVWEEMHHINCLARAFYSGAELDPTTIGSLIVLPSRTATELEDFDYHDVYAGRVVYVRIGEVGMIAGLNDSCLAASAHRNMLEKISGPLSAIQFLGLAALMAFLNLRLKQRPEFLSSLREDGHSVISGKVPREVSLEETDQTVFGEFLHGLLEGIFPALSSEECERIWPAYKTRHAIVPL
jgi:hypothetical protein